MQAFLHLSHSWGGGLLKWVQDFARTDRRSRNLILTFEGDYECYARRYVLYEGGTLEVLKRFEIPQPISELQISNEGYFRALSDVVEEFGVSHVFVSTMIGQAFDVFRLKAKKVVVAHEYFPFCPALSIYYDEVCTSCDVNKIASCLKNNPQSHIFRRQGADFWVGAREHALANLVRDDVMIVTPDSSVQRNLSVLEPRYRSIPFNVIPHGSLHPSRLMFGGADDARPLRILIPGRFAIQKGSELLKELVPELVHKGYEVIALGPGDDFFYKTLPSVRVIRDYGNEHLEQLLEELRPDLALITSVVPETFSLVLSELISYAIPALVPARGSFLNRITNEIGFLHDLTLSGILSTIEELNCNRQRLRDVSAALVRLPHRTLNDMIDDYYSTLEKWSSKVTDSVSSRRPPTSL